METNNLDLLVKLKKGFEEQLREHAQRELEYKNKISSLREQYEVLNKMDGLSNQEQLLDLITTSIKYEKSQLEQFISHRREYEETLNQHLYQVCKSLAAILSRHPYGRLCIG